MYRHHEVRIFTWDLPKNPNRSDLTVRLLRWKRNPKKEILLFQTKRKLISDGNKPHYNALIVKPYACPCACSEEQRRTGIASSTLSILFIILWNIHPFIIFLWGPPFTLIWALCDLRGVSFVLFFFFIRPPFVLVTILARSGSHSKPHDNKNLRHLNWKK